MAIERTQTKVLSFSDVSLHNHPKDCWVIINAKVYDVTIFLHDHPGGDLVLLQVAGEEASEEFESAGHGSAARLMLDEYYVGEIDPLSAPVTKTTPTTRLTRNSNMAPALPLEDDKIQNNYFRIKLLLFLVVLGTAIGVSLYV